MGALYSSLSTLLLLIAVTELFSEANSTTYWGDTEVLKQLKNGIDPNSVSQGTCLGSWDFRLDPCDSIFTQDFTCGLRCDVVVSNASRVTELALDPVGYVGSLDSVSWDLPYLETLDLSGNSFSGPVPDSLSNLTRLQRLSLSGNSLAGWVPASIGSFSGLEELCLDNNRLQGTIPSALNGLKNLKRLEIQGNNFTGAFPDLGQLGNLSYLDASNNAISGGLLATLPASLVELALRNNQIEGNIPASVQNTVYLQVLDLSHNKLNGSVPSGLFAHPSLQQLTLSYNQFESVQGPGDSGRGSGLIAVDLGNNRIRGVLPAFMGLMPKLSALTLENNLFTGLIPTQYALRAVMPGEGEAPFQRLLLGGNYLFGPIPGPLLRLREPGLATVRLGDNCLYRCPLSVFFFCEGGQQKPPTECRSFVPVIS